MSSEASVDDGESLYSQSQPPAPSAPQVVDAAASVHPFFRKDGIKPKKKTNKAGTVSCPGVAEDEIAETPRYCGISLQELEFAQRTNGDGAESSLFTDDDDDADDRRRRRHRPALQNGGEKRGKKSRSDEDALAAAAFGAEEDDEDDFDVCEGASEEQSSVAPGDRLLPIRGEACVGCCADRAIVEVIDRFVRANACSMSERRSPV